MRSEQFVAIALYKALLRQCAALPLQQTGRDALANVIRNRFRVARPQRIGLAKAFRAGYTAIDVLDSAVAGDAPSLQRLQSILERTPKTLKQRPVSKSEREVQEKAKALKETRAIEKRPKFVDIFPRKQVRGTRRVPSLVNANGFPFLRWMKPQPKRIGTILRSMIKRKQKRIDQHGRLVEYHIPLAMREDEWDEILEQFATNEETGSAFRSDEIGTFKDGADSALKDLNMQMIKSNVKRKHWIERMDWIVREEQRLKAEEDSNSNA
jgi:Complex 1 protein (LYR family)